MVTTVEAEESEDEWHISSELGYKNPKDKMEDIYRKNIKIKSVIAN
ncbi:2090_t:CDS:2 [Funneliformis mosseae]|uniref:2090_t:CDS:1 n=1 Tax=Funneliformis mosseae TaxID=27381 RepID=A0A9N8VEK1_FUNMO|nr:2090_t:CDS:2 [Funneliformis mosseae]